MIEPVPMDANDNSEKKTARLIKDPITFSLSILAIILTILNFYYSNIRIVNHLRVRTVIYQRTQGDSISKDGIDVSFAFINSGNRQAIVSEGRYFLGAERNFRNPGKEGVFDNYDVLPIVLEPKQMKVITLHMSYESIDSYQKLLKINTQNSERQMNICAFRFKGIDSYGKEYQSSTGDDMIIDKNKNGRIEITLLDTSVNNAKVYDIFKHDL